MPGRHRFLLISIFLLLAAAGLYLVGNGSVALWDRDEPRYAQASRQMLQSGDWVVPRFLGELRTKKPPLVYWCQAAAMRAWGDTPFAARLPSVVAVGGVMVLLAAAVGRGIGSGRGVWTAVVFATSLLVVFAAKVCLTDAVLLFWITVGQLCLFVAYRGHRRNASAVEEALPDPWATQPPRLRGETSGSMPAAWPVVLVFWAALGLGALTKGVNLAVHASTLIALAAFDVGRDWQSPRAWFRAIGWWKRLRPVVGVVIFAAVVTPWLVLVARREPAFLPAMFGNVGKHVGTSAEGHAAPPGYYLLTVWAFFLPWSPLLPLAVVTGWQRRRLPPIRFALAAVIGPWVVVEVMLSKLPHYLLPAYPALAFLTADVIARALRGRLDDLKRPGFVRGIGIWAAVVVALGIVPWLAVRRFPDAPRGATAALTAAAVVYAGTVFWLFRARRVVAGLAAMGGGMAAVCAVVFGLYLPRAGYLRTSIHVADVLRAHGVAGRATDPCPALMLDYKEPSLAFYQGGSLREHRNTSLTVELLKSAPDWLVVTRDVWDKPATEPAARDQLEIIDTYRGLDIADGVREVEVMVVRKKGPVGNLSRIQTPTEAVPTGG